MSKKHIVLITRGKRDAVDSIQIELYDSDEGLSEFCKERTKLGKYWEHWQVIEHGVEHELGAPDDWHIDDPNYKATEE